MIEFCNKRAVIACLVQDKVCSKKSSVFFFTKELSEATATRSRLQNTS